MACLAFGGTISNMAGEQFDLWLEFELYIPPYGSQSTDDPANDFANINVTLPDGRRYAMNVWTFAYLQQSRLEYAEEWGETEPSEYYSAPDLFVERLDRSTITRVVAKMLARGEIRDEWLCPRDENEETESCEP